MPAASCQKSKAEPLFARAPPAVAPGVVPGVVTGDPAGVVVEVVVDVVAVAHDSLLRASSTSVPPTHVTDA